MYRLLADAIVTEARLHISEGDCPTKRLYNIETLELALIEVAERATPTPVPADGTLREANGIVVNDMNHPWVFKALVELEYANGGVNALSPEPTQIVVPRCFNSQLDYIDRELSALSDEELSTFVDGEETEVLAIASRSPGLNLACALLNIMFDNPDLPITALSNKGNAVKGGGA